MFFAERSWPELKEAIEKNTLIILPVGTIEEHGMHLPVETDAAIAEAVARRIGEALKDEIPLLIMPTVWTGYSAKEMTRWPGTIRVRPRVLTDMLFDVCSSLIEMGFKKIVILDCHGHHSGILNVVAREIADTYGVYMAITAPAAMSAEGYGKIRRSVVGGSIHGGEWETSLMLHLGRNVNMDRATDEDIMRYHSEFLPGDNFVSGKKVFWSTWGVQQSKTGIYGDPTVASKETGEQIMRFIVDNYVKFIREFYAH
ncbi:MAG: creatininase family protein [Firmicutes bacterium]|nr:creatininase family protein [Bacillota bacterium]